MNDLYEMDTVAWAEHQAELLRRVAAGERPNAEPDWTNIAEEIDSLGKTQARELASRIATIGASDKAGSVTCWRAACGLARNGPARAR